MEKELCAASMEGQVEVVREILRNNPTINVNCKNASQMQKTF